MVARGQRLLTFATKNDWAPVLSALESAFSVKYIESGMSLHRDPLVHTTYGSLPHFGVAVKGASEQELRYLITMRETPIYCRRVRMPDGENRYVFDHETNPESLIFSPGGLFEPPKALINGETSKLSQVETAERLFQFVSKLIKANFSSIKSFRVGTEARTLKDAGYRLTSSVNSPSEYDLSLAEI